MKTGPEYPEKLALPRQKNVFSRERLFSQIDALLDRSAIWITGIPGAGKTTLVASYVKSRKIPCLWYQIDSNDHDIASFFDYFSAASERFQIDREAPFPLFRPEYLPTMSAFSRRFFRHCLNNAAIPLLIVIDDYQEIDSDSVLHEIIGTAILEAPEGITFVILSREEPPGQMQRLLMNRIIGWIESADLKLDMDEAMGFAEFHSDRELETTAVRQIHQLTDGWIAGMVLMLEALDANLDVLKCREMTKDFFFNYFAGEIFHKKMDSIMQEFLMKIALFRAVTPDGARALTGIDNAENILCEMSRQRYFVSRKTGSADVFNLHPLFREFLIWKMKERFTPAEITDIRLKAAEWLVAAGEFDNAFDLYYSARDWQAISTLIHERAEEMITRHRLQTLSRWLTAMPDVQLNSSPWLLYWKGICSIPFNPFESSNYLARAFGRFQEMKETEGMLLSVAGAIEAIMAGWGDFKEVDIWIERVGEILNKGFSFPSVEMETRTTFAVFTALMFRKPDHPDMSRWEKKVLNLIYSDLGPEQKVLLGGYLLHYRFWIGDISGTRIIIDSLREIAQPGKVSPLTFLTYKMQEAVYLWHIAEFDSCINAAEEGIEAGNEAGVQIIDAWLLAQAAYASLSSNDLSSAGRYLQRIKPVISSKRILDISHYHYLSGWYHLLKGEVESAYQHCRMALRFAIEAGTPFPEGLITLTMARIMYKRGDIKDAGKLNERAISVGISMKSDLLVMIGYFNKAWFRIKEGTGTKSLEPLRAGMKLAREMNMLNFAGWDASVMTDLCIEALRAGIEVEYVKDLIRRRNLVPEAPPLELEDWPWPLKVFTLGKFSLLVDDRPLYFSGKARQKPLELLKALIALGGQDVRQEQISDALWPDADGDRAQRALITNIHRLRKLTGHERAIVFQNQRLSLDRRYWWVDVWAVELLMDRVEESIKGGQGGVERISGLLEEVLSLYKGAFLEGETIPPPVLSRRERLRKGFIRMHESAGTFFEDLGDWRKAVRIYNNALEVDDLAEEFYQRLMICYRNQGRMAEAMAVYERCRTVLDAVLGIAPSVKTVEIYRSLSGR